MAIEKEVEEGAAVEMKPVPQPNFHIQQPLITATAKPVGMDGLGVKNLLQ